MRIYILANTDYFKVLYDVDFCPTRDIGTFQTTGQ